MLLSVTKPFEKNYCNDEFGSLRVTDNSLMSCSVQVLIYFESLRKWDNSFEIQAGKPGLCQCNFILIFICACTAAHKHMTLLFLSAGLMWTGDPSRFGMFWEFCSGQSSQNIAFWVDAPIYPDCWVFVCFPVEYQHQFISETNIKIWGFSYSSINGLFPAWYNSFYV